MPRGVYARKKDVEQVAAGGFLPDTNETEAQIDAKLNERFDILEALTRAAISGDVKSLVVSGPAGLGKSYTVEHELDQWDPNSTAYTIAKGYVRTTGLYKLLYQHRHPGNVIVFDDADTVFFDDTSLNLLKAACDTTERRRLSYLAEANLVDEDSAERIPRTFDFDGTVIFITNIDFDAYIDRGHKLAPHLAALVSRSHYIDLDMKTRRDYLVRIRQVIGKGMLASRGLNFQQQKELVDFLEENLDSFRELSLRMAIKLADLSKSYPTTWKKMARVTCFRNKR